MWVMNDKNSEEYELLSLVCYSRIFEDDENQTRKLQIVKKTHRANIYRIPHDDISITAL